MNFAVNRIIRGDVLGELKKFPDETIDMIISSPPYYGLRDYGTATWEGGDEKCEHKTAKEKSRYDYSLASSPIQDGERKGTDAPKWKDTCPSCGAKRIDQQIGLERTLGEYLEKMLLITSELQRVLKKTGTLWWNHGDI